MKQLLIQAAESHKICRILFKYDNFYRFYFPLIVGEKLFLSMEEDDFLLDGYTIRRFKDIAKAEKQNGKYLEIDAAEGLVVQLIVPTTDRYKRLENGIYFIAANRQKYH